jgi:hypothetical protein
MYTVSYRMQRSIRKVMFCVLCLLLPVLQSCDGVTEETITETKRDAFKVEVRTQEFHNSGIRNVDICVAETASRKFPNEKYQCFSMVSIFLA